MSNTPVSLPNVPVKLPKTSTAFSMFTKFLEEFKQVLTNIRTFNGKREISLHEGLQETLKIINSKKQHNRIIFIGNGGSAAIASHQATDFFKNGGVRAMAFNDPSLLTCLSNDYSYSEVFEKAIAGHAQEGDVLIAISSSGRSQNILRGVAAAKNQGCRIITLSGFDANNPLREEGEMNFYVPSRRYSHVENIHLLLLHTLLDILMEMKSKLKAEIRPLEYSQNSRS